MSIIAKKPGAVRHTMKSWNGTPIEFEVARVHEDFYSEQFAETGDPLKCNRTVIVLGDENLFDGYSNKDQAAMAEKLSAFFAKYAAWIKSRAEGLQGPAK